VAPCPSFLSLHRQSPPAAAKHETDHGIVGSVDQRVLDTLVGRSFALAVEPRVAEPCRLVRQSHSDARLAAVKDVLGAVLELSLDHHRPHLSEDAVERVLKCRRSLHYSVTSTLFGSAYSRVTGLPCAPGLYPCTCAYPPQCKFALLFRNVCSTKRTLLLCRSGT